jgi:hypothetical protein
MPIFAALRLASLTTESICAVIALEIVASSPLALVAAGGGAAEAKAEVLVG